MADVDDGDALGPEALDHPKQGIGFVTRQAAGRFVHDQHPGVNRQRLGNLDNLARADWQAVYGAGYVDLEVEFSKKLACASAEFAPSHKAIPGRRAPGIDVFSNREGAGEAEFADQFVAVGGVFRQLLGCRQDADGCHGERVELGAEDDDGGIGQARGEYTVIDLSATTDVADVGDFRNLVVRAAGDTLVRLRDVARVELGSEDYESATWYKGTPAIFIGVTQAPGANPPIASSAADAS